MSEKVKVPTDVSKAIDKLRNDGLTDCEIVACVQGDQGRFGPECIVQFAEIGKWFATESGLDNSFLSALVNGYEVEKTPEDKVREYYEQVIRTKREMFTSDAEKYATGEITGIRHTLDLLNIQIPGVNVDK